jgi:hypothetical protein
MVLYMKWLWKRIIIIIIIIIIGKDTISFTQGIYSYIPETNHVPKEYNVAAILSLLFMVPISLAPALALMYFHISTYRSTSMCAVPNMAVFCSSLTSWFPGMVLTYFLNDFEMVPVAQIITGITLVFTFHISCVYIIIVIIIIIIINSNGVGMLLQALFSIWAGWIICSLLIIFLAITALSLSLKMWFS